MLRPWIPCFRGLSNSGTCPSKRSICEVIVMVRHQPGSRRAGLLVADDAGFLRAAKLAFDEAVTTHCFIQLFAHFESLPVASFHLRRGFFFHGGMLA